MRAVLLAGFAALLALPAGFAFAQQPVVPVSTAKAVRADVPIITHGIGTVQPFQSVLVRARVDGTIQEIGFSEGQQVKPGDLLAVIDPRPYQAALDQAVAKKAADVAQLGNARKDLTRYSDLARSDFATKQSVDTQSMTVSQLGANIEADDAAIAAAKLNLDFTRITSPIEGQAGLRLVDSGNLVHANDASGIVVINQIHPISVIFTLPQDSLPTVQDARRAAGATPLAVVAYTSDNKRALGTGTLLTTDNAIDSNSGTIKLKATFANQDDRLWPGQFVNAHLQLSTARDVVVVPSPAIIHGVDGLYVFQVKPGDVVGVVPVEIGQDDGVSTVVTSGLSGGESVVTGGQSRLTDGTRVASSSRDDAAPAAGTSGASKIGG